VRANLVKGESRGKAIYCFGMAEPQKMRFNEAPFSKRRVLWQSNLLLWHGRAVKMRSKGIFKERFCLFGFV